MGLTQQEVADRAGLSLTTVNQIEGLKRLDPEFGSLEKIAAVLDHTIDSMVWSGKLMNVDTAEVYRRSVGKAIAARREALGLTKNAVAMRAEISPSYLNEVEQGRSSPTIDKIHNICVVLNIAPEKLLEIASSMRKKG